MNMDAHFVDNADMKFRRKEMVRQQLLTRGIRDEKVLATFEKVPRHAFVPQDDVQHAYDDHPMSIGMGQTISQPYMVALMTESLELKSSDRVLEVGTGSGYQAAILAEMVADVYTIERIEELSRRAQAVLKELGYTNVHFKVGDGTLGWTEEAPFDKIIVTAAAPAIPRSLVEQLVEGGIIVIPVGGALIQSLVVGVKKGKKLETRDICDCVFVKLIGSEGWK